jgi:hypothetical protein
MTSTLEILQTVTTGTITTMLLKKGIRRSWMAGAMPLGFSGKRAGAGGSGDAGQLVRADLDPLGDRGHAGKLRRRR